MAGINLVIKGEPIKVITGVCQMRADVISTDIAWVAEIEELNCRYSLSMRLSNPDTD